MIKISVNIKPAEIKDALSRLPTKERAKILEEFKDEVLMSEFSQIVKKIRSKGKPPSFKKITKACEEARKQVYEREIKNRP